MSKFSTTPNTKKKCVWADETERWVGLDGRGGHFWHFHNNKRSQSKGGNQRNWQLANIPGSPTSTKL